MSSGPFHRLATRLRVKHHEVLEREARRTLERSSGAAFDAARERLVELALCPDPATCDHTRGDR